VHVTATLDAHRHLRQVINLLGDPVDLLEDILPPAGSGHSGRHGARTAQPQRTDGVLHQAADSWRRHIERTGSIADRPSQIMARTTSIWRGIMLGC
jgi:hypothetical protein